MPTKTVTLNVIGDSSGAERTLTNVADHADGITGRVGKAFGGLFSQLNTTGVLGPLGESLDRIGSTFDHLAGKGQNLGKTLMGIGGGGLAVGGLLTAIAGPEKQAQQQLDAAITATGKSYDDYSDRIERAVKRQEGLGHDAKDTMEAIRVLTQATQDAGKSIGEMGVVTNLAAAKHESLTEAATSLARVHGGATKVLKEFGISAEKAADNTKQVAAAQKAAEGADDALAKAKERLLMLQERQGVAHREHKISTEGVTAAQTALAHAEQRVQDLMVQRGAKARLTVADDQAMEHAHVAVADAQKRLVDATQKVSDAHAAASAAAGPSIAQAQALQLAQEAVADATKKAADAQDKLNGMQQTTVTTAQAADDNLKKLGDRLDGQASAAAHTFAGRMKALRAEIEDGAARWGQRYGPALMGVSAGLSVLGTGLETAKAVMGHFRTASEAATVATEGLAAAEETEAAASAVALGPILLIVAAVAAVGVAVYELWKHWSQVWGFIKDVAKDAWHWITHHTLLIAAAFGPLGLAVKVLADHWSDIWNGIKQVVSDVWDFIKDVFHKIQGGVKDVVDTINHLPGAGIAKKAVGVLGHIPGFADGGVVPGPAGAAQLAIVHGGETIIPPGSRIAGGGNTVVNVTVQGHALSVDRLADEIRRALLTRSRSLTSLGLA